MTAQNQMPIELIQPFLLLAEELNISRAARRLNLSQPALTRKLRNLEVSLGAQLFVRQSRGLTLTAVGRELRRNITPAFETLLSTITDIKDAQNKLSGAVAFGCFSELGTHLLAPALLKFVENHPSVTMDIRFLSENEIITGVAQGQLNLGVSSRAPEHEGIRSYKLLSETIHVVTSAQNLDLEKNPNPRFAGFRTQDRLLNQFLKTHSLWSRKSPPEIAVAVNSHTAMLSAVRQLHLYAALPLHSISKALKDKSIRLASKRELHNDVHLILPATELPDRKTQELSKFLRHQMKNPEEMRQ
ncbi:MAG: LysR family transcriptional regulator [Betaproteobacteria bacterium]|nr:LysR family transcriptional regulator [Betaproteobacteria bacterium]